MMNKFDELFAKKLANHEVSPSERANKLFLERISKTQVKPVFWTSGRRYFSAAASMALVMGIAYLYYPSQKETTVNIAKLAPLKSKSVVKDIVPNTNQIELIKETLKENKVLKNVQISTPTFAQESTPFNTLNEDERVEKIMDLNHETSVTQTKQLLPIPEQTEDDTYIVVTHLEEQVAVNEIPGIEDDVEYIVEQDAADGLLTKIFEEVKHLKKGEHLDFTKFGLKNLDEEGFIVSETKKIKNTINRIKSIFNN